MDKGGSELVKNENSVFMQTRTAGRSCDPRLLILDCSASPPSWNAVVLARISCSAAVLTKLLLAQPWRWRL